MYPRPTSHGRAHPEAPTHAPSRKAVGDVSPTYGSARRRSGLRPRRPRTSTQTRHHAPENPSGRGPARRSEIESHPRVPEAARQVVGRRVVAVERAAQADRRVLAGDRTEEHTSELQSLMRISYSVFCLKKKKKKKKKQPV